MLFMGSLPSNHRLARLAQSVERETLMYSRSNQLDYSVSQGCGFDPHVGLPFCVFLLIQYTTVTARARRTLLFFFFVRSRRQGCLCHLGLG